jgi:hypothetical protein
MYIFIQWDRAHLWAVSALMVFLWYESQRKILGNVWGEGTGGCVAEEGW